MVNFNGILDNEFPWNDEEESIGLLNGRISYMNDWLCSRKEKTIAIVGHSSFLGQFKDNKIGDEANELRHCFPYEINWKKTLLNTKLSNHTNTETFRTQRWSV